MKIIILDGYTANPGDLSWNELKEFGELIVYDRTKADDTIERAKEADILLTNKVCLGRKEIEQLPNLKYIGVLATGYNVVDLKVAQERGIIVTNVPAYSTESVAQMVFAHLLTVTHHTEYYAKKNRQGQWSASKDFCYWDMPLMELYGKTFGIVGLGHIGSRVAEIANAFGMKVVAYTSKPADKLSSFIKKVSMKELFEESDVISLHCPLTPETHHLINYQTLQEIKPSAILINTGRGSLVCDEDVAQALNADRLGAYCADVITEEPPSIDNPLLSCKKAFLTPHIAWATIEARKRLINVAINNVRAFINRQPQNVII